ncbi:MAG TPA: hypothetical protein VNG13_14575 [Mycobacteriales bacterium]|nr:hypothetical protein [Mycobacteriales bacterium]
MRTRLAVALAASSLAALAIPALASPGSPAGGTSRPGSTTCADGKVTWSPTTIWPPNHKMQTVTINYTAPPDATPVTSDTTTITVGAITDNKMVNGSELNGSGQPNPQQGPDFTGTFNTASSPEGTTATTTAQVRAERSGTGTGRVYTIQLTCSETAAGTAPDLIDSSSTTITVDVPHDQR